VRELGMGQAHATLALIAIANRIAPPACGTCLLAALLARMLPGPMQQRLPWFVLAILGF